MILQTLYFCPKGDDEVLFEDTSGGQTPGDFVGFHKLTMTCPRCGGEYSKSECIELEILSDAGCEGGVG